jgi:general secretion pathway protein B
MSFILDALKKSEAERLRKDAPGISDVPGTAREKSASHWIWIVVVLVTINIVVLVAIFMRPDRLPDPAASQPIAESGPVSPSESAREASFPETVAEARPVEPPPVTLTTNPDTAAVTDAAPQYTEPEAAVANYEAPQITESYATFNDLRAQGLLQLADLHLDIHVYSSEPTDRFVFVNMTKYKERATLDEGPVVVEITPDGVILEFRGTGFLLPRE